MNAGRCFLSASVVAVTLVAAGSANAICRNLVPGDPYYKGWSRCCDGQGGSFWTQRSSGRSKWYRGNCRSWGIRASGPRVSRVCRYLRQGEPYFRNWKHCCDTGDGRSVWTKRWGGGQRITYNRTCRSYGIR